MSKFSSRAYDMCATGAQDGSTSASNSAGAGLLNAVTVVHDNATIPYVTGIIVTSGNPTATVTGTVTLAGVAGGPISLILVEAATVGGIININFDDPLPATSNAADVVLTVPVIASGAATAATILYYRRPE